MASLIDKFKPGHSEPVVPPEPRSEAEVMANWKTPGPPTVSICCATFNHARYVKDALHGFLSQDTSFPFEIIVRDDASTDGTAEIVREYVSRYPRIVRAVFETENQLSRGVRPSHVWADLAQGKYVALCEGDDFWLSPHKLQRQVDLLESHPEAVMSVAGTDVYRQVEEKLEYLETHSGNGKVLQTFDDIKHQYFHTSTYVIRAEVMKEVVRKYFLGEPLLGDTALRLILISRGPFVLLPEVVSVYRKTGSGIWTSLDGSKQLQWELAFTRKLLDLLTGEYKDYQGERIFYLLSVSCYRNLNSRRFVEVMRLIPEILLYGVRFKLPGYVKRRLRALGSIARIF